MTSPFWTNKYFHIRFKSTYQLQKYAFDKKLQNAVQNQFRHYFVISLNFKLTEFIKKLARKASFSSTVDTGYKCHLCIWVELWILVAI